jgi:hypothetical protein
MKIAIYYHRIEITGGVEKAIIELSKLYSRNNDVTVVFSDRSSNIESLIKISRYAKVRYIDVVQDECYDICFYETIYPTNVNANKRTLIINNNWGDCNVNINHVPDYFDEYIAVGNECLAQAKEILNEDIKLIPNLIDTKEIMELSNKKIDIEPYFLVVSRISEEKGFDNILKVAKSIPDKTIHVIGSNNNKKEEERIKSKFEGIKNVIFLGLKDNPYPYMKKAKFLLQLSKREAQCLTMFESLILGTPVIATDFGTAKENIKSNMGILFKKDLSDFDRNKILNSNFSFLFKYNNTEKEWLELLKMPPKIDYKFTILIPNYNNAEWLEKCLGSVLKQTYKNYEIIFIDDMSEDNSVIKAKEILKHNKDKKIISLQSKRYNGGARNEGIIASNSDYTVSIDSDDWLSHDKVLENINNRLNGEDVLFLGFQQTKNGKYYAKVIPNYRNHNDALTNGVCAIWSKVVKTELMKETLFCEGTLMEDKVQHMRICNKMKKFRCLPEITHYWNKGNVGSVTCSKGIKWETSAWRWVGDLTDFLYECKDEYKEFVKGLIKKVKDNAEKNIYRQGF